MNLGRPSNFSPNDSPDKRARSLTDTFASVWRLLKDVNPVVASAATNIAPYGHTSEMPDLYATNRDHDRSYYRRYDAEVMAYRFALAAS